MVFWEPHSHLDGELRAAVFPRGYPGLVHGGLSTRMLSQGVWAQKARVASFLA